METFHSGDKTFTYYSHVYESFSRIDHFLITPALIYQITHTDIKEISISDHALITIQLKMDRDEIKSKICKFPTYIKNNTLFNKFLQEYWEEFNMTNNPKDYFPVLFWETSKKAYMRGRIIAYTSAYKRNLKSPR